MFFCTPIQFANVIIVQDAVSGPGQAYLYFCVLLYNVMLLVVCLAK